MSMKKILMAAVAVSALTAGVASAASINSAKVSNITVYTGSTATPYKIATETVFGTGGLATTTTAGHNVTVAKIDSGPVGVGNYTVSYTLSGPATFASVVANGDLTTDVSTTGTCSPSAVVSSGGGAGAQTVTYAVTVSGTCSTTVADPNQGPMLYTLNAPLKVSGLGDVTVTAAFTSGGTSIDNGSATPRTLITNATGFSASATANTVTTQWLLSGGAAAYTTLDADLTIGSIVVGSTVSTAAGPFVLATGASAAKVDDASQALTYNASIAGSVSNLSLAINGVAMSENTAKTISTLAGITAGTKAVTVSLDATTTSQSESTYSLTVTPIAATSSYTAPAAFTQALQSVTLEGTNFLAPWIAGSQSGSSSSQVRVSNNGATGTGAVTLMLKSPTRNSGTTAGATTCTSSTLSKLSSISANDELVISTTDLTTCFGDFKRGDMVVTIQSPKANITAKARLTTTAGGISEISLGGLNVTDQTY